MTIDDPPPLPAAGARLRIGRGVVLFASAVLVLGFVVGLGLWGYHRERLLPQWVAPDGWSATQLRAVLTDVGLPAEWLFTFFVLLELGVATAAVVAAAFVLRGPVSGFRLYLAFVLVLFGTMSGSVPLVYGALAPDWADVIEPLQGVAWVALLPLAYVFPDGRFVPRWGRWAALGWLAYLPFVGLLDLLSQPSDSAAAGVPLLMLFASTAVAAGYRYFRVADATQRQQIRWVVVAIGLRFVVSLTFAVTPVNALAAELGPRGLAIHATIALVSYTVAAMLPAAIAVAIVRHRLFDIDVWLNRALVYAGLTAFVVGTYALVVAAAGLAVPEDGRVPAVLATAVVAVAFHPVRQRVQRAVSRIVFGHRAEPYALVAELGRRLGSALPPDAVLQTIVDTIGPALRLRYAHASLAGGLGVTYPSAEIRQPPGTASFPLRWRDEDLGMLTVGARPGEPLSAAERQLIAEVTRQAGIAVRAATLTAALRRSRERLATAREQERRRLHQDLHDGLGPTLASLYQRIDAARGLLATRPEAAERLLAGAGEQTRTAIGDIRRLVYRLRPPALDELGLVAAIEEIGGQLNPDPERLTVAVVAESLPPLPAVVEVAAYRIAVEALTNTIRHAGARHATVRLTMIGTGSAARLVIEVTDDGSGLTRPAGVGRTSMRDRAEEIGGDVTVTGRSPGGTTVTARLPLPVTDTDAGGPVDCVQSGQTSLEAVR